MTRYIFPLILGLGGVAILLWLGFWQLDRLAWKEAMLTEIEAQISAAPGALPPEGTDTRPLKYQPVRLVGATTGQEVLVLSGQKGIGAGYQVISAFETGEGRRVLVDLGFVAEAQKAEKRSGTAMIVEGNLHWPEETDSYTPPPDPKTGLWFAREVEPMAAILGTEPILVVAAQIEGDAQGIEPQPIAITGIPNDHLNYAITWFSLAFVWAVMTLALLWRIRRQQI